MIKLYNTFSILSSGLRNFFSDVASLSKPHLNFVSNFIVALCRAESVVTSDVVKKLHHDYFDDTLFDSKIRKVERFLNNPLFDSSAFFSSIVNHIISNFIPKNKNIYISFDHMFCKDKFTIFLFSLKIGKQGIPIWFKCFKSSYSSEAFQISLFKEGILYVHNLFANFSDNFYIIFLADRWFPLCDVISFIDSLGDFYCIRAKSDSLIFSNSPALSNVTHIGDISPCIHHSKYFFDVLISEHKFSTNLAVARLTNHKEPLYILTNDNPCFATKHYSYRFGAIECIFKNQKSNGFYLEKTQIKNIRAFTNLFTLVCVALLWLFIIGTDYSKKSRYRIPKPFRIRCSQKIGNSPCYKRKISLFNIGLIIFNLAFNSPHYYLLKFNFHLYDI